MNISIEPAVQELEWEDVPVGSVVRNVGHSSIVNAKLNNSCHNEENQMLWLTASGGPRIMPASHKAHGRWIVIGTLQVEN